uniref:Putative secreted protein n=1 Tax=Xenopsylla cheopis TaxID=163159 RepID=A0A6M2E201_XENCH
MQMVVLNLMCSFRLIILPVQCKCIWKQQVDKVFVLILIYTMMVRCACPFSILGMEDLKRNGIRRHLVFCRCWCQYSL